MCESIHARWYSYSPSRRDQAATALVRKASCRNTAGMFVSGTPSRRSKGKNCEVKPKATCLRPMVSARSERYSTEPLRGPDEMCRCWNLNLYVVEAGEGSGDAYVVGREPMLTSCSSRW